jgi:hypothetical protein
MSANVNVNVNVVVVVVVVVVVKKNGDAAKTANLKDVGMLRISIKYCRSEPT